MMFVLPEDIMQRLIMHCQKNDIGLAQIGTERVTIIIMGRRDLSPDQASIMACHLLLSGVLSGGFAEDNRKRIEDEEQSSAKVN